MDAEVLTAELVTEYGEAIELDGEVQTPQRFFESAVSEQRASVGVLRRVAGAGRPTGPYRRGLGRLLAIEARLELPGLHWPRASPVLGSHLCRAAALDPRFVVQSVATR